MNSKFKICFLIENPDISGGTYVIFEHAIRIQRRQNVEVILITELPISQKQLFWHPDANELIWKTYNEIVNDEFDAVIATWWPTAYEAHRIKSKSYLYFNQSVESKFYKDSDVQSRLYADSTYLLNLLIITEATWIQNYLRNNYGTEAKLVLNGIRKDIYTTNGISVASKDPNKLRVLIEGPLGVFFKNTEKAVQLAKQSEADEIWLLTSSNISSFPGVDKVFSRIPILKTPEVYRSCDLLIKLSYVEGMFGPPLEMFHCGGTAIVYDVTGHDEYIIHNKNGIVVKTDDEQAVIDSINSLKRDPALLKRLKEGSKETALRWNDWETASEHFEKAICELIIASKQTIFELSERTRIIKGWLKVSNQSPRKRKNIDSLKRFINAHPFLYGIAKKIKPFLLKN